MSSVGGPSAKGGFRYQDLCAMYLTLEGFRKDPSFERVYCEQEKMDFEIWSTSAFAGYQVKTSTKGLTAKEANKVFLFYLARSTSAGKGNSSFKFIFGEQPLNSLDHLFTYIRSGKRGVKYSGQVGKFIDTALKGVSPKPLAIDFLLLAQEDIEHMVFAVSAELLKERLGNGNDIPTEAIKTFLARLRDEIDKISCKKRDQDRIYSSDNIGTLIDTFLAGTKIQKLEAEGRRSVEITLPEELQERIVRAMVDKPLPPVSKAGGAEGEPIQST